MKQSRAVSSHAPNLATITIIAAVCGCGSPDRGTSAVMDLPAARSAVGGGGHFFDFPFPSDLRITGDGRPDLSGYPNPTGSALIENLIAVSGDRQGFTTQSTSYFRFDAPLAALDVDNIIMPDARTIWLMDIDEDSPQRGTRYPIVAQTLPVENDWAPEHVLAVAPVPGIVLRGDTTYGVVVFRDLGDAAGEPLARLSRVALADGEFEALYEPLWGALGELGTDRDDVAAATVFTTGDAVADLADLTDRVLEATRVEIDGLAVDPVDGASHSRFCELRGTALMPQYQVGTPPFNSGGLFEFGSDGLPVVQRYEETPVVLTLPTSEMPAGGYPLMIYFHGSGGVADQAVDRGRFDGISLRVGEGPAFVVAEHGIATVAASLPLSPDRLPGASAIEYLNFGNLAAFRDTFRQGVIESRLLLSAALELEIDPAMVEACEVTLPAGEVAFHYDAGKVVASGQSMGGMYTNLVSPVDPRIRAAVPTGAGGHWNRMILSTDVVPGARDLVSLIIRTDATTMSFVHPGINLLSLAWESAEPFAFMPRLARRPLPGHPVIPVYQPVGQDDEYFSTDIYDAAALAYGNQLAGDEVWPGMRRSLALAGLDTPASYPVAGNLESDSGQRYTGVVVQYPNDGLMTGHYIFAQLDEVKFQYGCFLATFLASGEAVVPEPTQLGSKCPIH